MTEAPGGFELPQVVHELLAGRNLKVREVFRNGPRYWVGQLVGADGQDLILKAVIDDTPWSIPGSGVTSRPSDQLRTEINVLRALGEYSAGLKGGLPKLIESSETAPLWMLKSVLNGMGMAAGASAFVYRAEFYETSVTEAMIDYVASYQAISAELRGLLGTGLSTYKTGLAYKIRAVDLHEPTELLTPYAPAVTAYLEARTELHDSNLSTFAHGEVYPPHIYLENGSVSLIDWENASLNTPLHDFVAIWIRGFDNPSWQADFYERLAERGLIAGDTGRELWRIELLVQASGNLNYLHWSALESSAIQTTAIVALRRQIEETLYGA